MSLLRQMDVVGTPSDGTTVTNTNTNTNLSGITIGSGNTFTIEAADAFGFRQVKAVQGGANQLTSYQDLGAGNAVTRWTEVFPFKYTWAGSAVQTPIRRWYAGAIGSGNLGSLAVTNTNKLQFVEGGTGSPLSVTSTPSMTPGSDYIGVADIDVVANTFSLSVYASGSSSSLLTISGTLGADMAAAAGIQSTRLGINAASTGMTLWTSEGWQIFNTTPTRYDLVVPPTIDVDQTLADNLVDLRGSAAASGQTPLTFPNPTHVSGPTLTYQDLTGTGLWLFDQDATTDAVYTMTVSQADAQTATQNVTIPHLPTANVNAPLVPSGSSPGTTWA